jgi:outer membrane biogenesis lipoprotein LolB
MRYAISVKTPESHANSVVWAKQGRKGNVASFHWPLNRPTYYAISVSGAISVKNPESHANSVVWAKQGRKGNVASFHWPLNRPTYYAISVSGAISVGVKTQPL